MYYLVVLFIGGPAVPTILLVWQCCHHSFSACVQASSIFFLIDGPALEPSAAADIRISRRISVRRKSAEKKYG